MIKKEKHSSDERSSSKDSKGKNKRKLSENVTNKMIHKEEKPSSHERDSSLDSKGKNKVCLKRWLI